MILYIWIGVFAALLVTKQILQSEMIRDEFPGQPPLGYAWRRGLAIFIDPNRFTQRGKAYRLWTIRVDVATLLWGIPGLPIAQMLNGHFG
ncbi:hypothetical protein [Bradyrhizobium sp. SRS-191]|uniref:hypothetical protein n=1 Tax=Bradyrhizobium sp. SRS-191 TaxID=2962606 RepID=UPI00211E742A|nr:hypothetical protein [Bradyrhizobium sp. SRS-191]